MNRDAGVRFASFVAVRGGMAVLMASVAGARDGLTPPSSNSYGGFRLARFNY